VLFIGSEKQRTSDQGAYVRWLLPSDLMAVKYYLEGKQKVIYIRWSHLCSPIRFKERTSGSLPQYVHTTNSSVRSLDLAYILPKVQITPLVSLVTQSPN
jgi:hypothetical protein